MLIRGRKSSTGSLTRQAIVDVAVLAMLVDGESSEAEGLMLGATIGHQDAFANVSAEQLTTMMDQTAAKIQGWGDLSAALEHITAEIGTSVQDRATAFGIAYSIACADGEMADQEEAFLSELADSFALTQDQVDTMINAVDEGFEAAENAEEVEAEEEEAEEGEAEAEEAEEAEEEVVAPRRRVQPGKHALSSRGEKHPVRKFGLAGSKGG